MRFPSWLRSLAIRLSSSSGHRTRQQPTPRRGFRPRVEALEDRCVPATQITEFPVPTQNSVPAVIAAGPDGNLWFTESGVTRTNSDGSRHGIIGRSTLDGHIDEFEIPLPHAGWVVAGPDGNIWFGETSGDGPPTSSKVGVMSTAGVVLPGREYALPAGTDGSLAFGPDGSLWISEYWNDEVARMNQDGQITARYQTPFPFHPYGSANITVGPDGTVWLTSAVRIGSTGMLGRITPQGNVTAFSYSGLGLFRGLVVGPDGNVWAGEVDRGKIARISPTGQLLAEYTIPTPGSQPYSLAVGPDGSIWFTESGTSSISGIGRVTMQGSISEFPTPTPNCDVAIITRGPGNTLWFTEEGGNQIGKIDLGPPATLLNAIPLNASPPFQGGGPTPLGVSFNGMMYYAGYDPTYGRELWRTDGTPAGTTRVTDLNPGAGDSGPDRLTVVGNVLYFETFVSPQGILWASDGTTAGTHPVTDASGNILPASNLAALNGTLYFYAIGPDGNTRLWRTTSDSQAVELPPVTGAGRFTIDAINQAVWAGAFYFQDDAGNLYKYDGSSTTSELVHATNDSRYPGGTNPPSRLPMLSVNGRLLFNEFFDSAGSGLWGTDGSTGGTSRITDIVGYGTSDNRGQLAAVVNQVMYFPAYTSLANSELWASDETPGGTRMVKDINQQTNSFGNPFGSFPDNFTTVGDTLYFVADDGIHGASSGRATGPRRGR